MGKFKIGDLVRVLPRNKALPYSHHGALAGEVFTVRDVRGEDGDNLDTEVWAFYEHEVEPAFTLTTGNFYRTASGAVTGRVTNGDTGFEAVVDGRVRIFDAAGGAVHGGDDIVDEWTPKVGERVRFTNECDTDWWFGPTTKHKEGIVSGPATCHKEYQFDVAVSGEPYPAHVDIDHIEPLPVATPEQPAADMKIEAGRYYRTRDGRMVRVDHNPHYDSAESDSYPWKHDCGHGGYHGLTENGTSCINHYGSDIIAEWIDEPVAATPSAPVAAQVDAIADEYGPVVSNDNEPTPDLTISISLDTGNMHEELDELIAKLKKIKKLQRQVGLAA